MFFDPKVATIKKQKCAVVATKSCKRAQHLFLDPGSRGQVDRPPGRISLARRLLRGWLRISLMLENARGQNGDPICPVCDKPLRIGESAIRWEAYILHVPCAEEARAGGVAPSSH